MPEVIFTGPDGRLEGRYQPSSTKTAPIALVLHPHPRFGGTMNNQIVYKAFYMFQERGFTCLRFNFRGVGRSQGYFDHGVGELADAAAALDWIQTLHPDSRGVLDRRLLLRRMDRHAAPHAPSGGRGLHLHRSAAQPLRFLVPRAVPVLRPHHQRGSGQEWLRSKSVQGLVDKLKTQKGIVIDHVLMKGANHFFEGSVDELIETCANYLDMRLEAIEAR